jgi:hypothetical protein
MLSGMLEWLATSTLIELVEDGARLAQSVDFQKVVSGVESPLHEIGVKSLAHFVHSS